MEHLVVDDPVALTSGFVDVITLPGISRPLGYRLFGVRPGPSAMVSADSNIVELIFEKLTGLPTLPWLRGSIYLLSQQVMDSADANILKAAMADITFDEAILLPFADSTDPDMTEAATQGYWTTLRLCTRLGIIEGRGVNAYGGTQ